MQDVLQKYPLHSRRWTGGSFIDLQTETASPRCCVRLTAVIRTAGAEGERHRQGERLCKCSFHTCSSLGYTIQVAVANSCAKLISSVTPGVRSAMRIPHSQGICSTVSYLSTKQIVCQCLLPMFHHNAQKRSQIERTMPITRKKHAHAISSQKSY